MSIRNNVTDQAIGLLLTNLAEAGGAVPSRVLKGWVRNALPDIALNPSGYSDARSFALDYQAVSLLKKYPYLEGSSDSDRRSRAIEKYLDSEEACARTSIRFVNHAFNQWQSTRLHEARDFVYKVLGEFSWDDALPLCDFGPGASQGIPRRRRHKVNKLGNDKPTVTGQCHSLLTAYMAWAPLMKGVIREPSVVPGNVVTTVPKNAKIDRVIATEPLWNMFFQKGIGGLISRRLQRIGLDIPSQQPKNKDLARLGSLYGTYATLDLSSASDSISMEFVRFMVPTSWWDAFCITRSPYSDVDQNRVFLRKIASMGNGFCFELETLLFLALAYSASPRAARSVNIDIAAYGDDIIVRPEVADDLISLLGVAGFRVNPEKSFIVGPFRESCGGHFFDGFDVTPYMLDKHITSPHDIYWFINSIRRWASRYGESLYCDSLVKEAYDYVLSKLPPRLRRIRIPPGCGDDGVMSSFDEACPSPYFDKSVGMVDGWRYLAFNRSPRKRHHDGYSALLVSLYELERVQGTDFPSVTFSVGNKVRADVRDNHWRCLDEETGSIRLSVQPRQLLSQWEWLGPWV